MTGNLGISVFAALFFGHKVVKVSNNAWCYLVKSVDLTTGLTETIAEEGDEPKELEKW